MANYIDINLHTSTENYRDINIIDNELALFMQEIELAVKIGPGEIWGIYQSIDINKYVFNQYVTLSQVKQEISTYIGNNCAHASVFPWSVNAQFLDIEGKKLLYIVVKISKTDSNQLPEDFMAKFLLGQ